MNLICVLRQVTDNTAAFQAALDRASTTGGGIVVAPAGKYLFKGQLVLQVRSSEIKPRQAQAGSLTKPFTFFRVGHPWWVRT
jgi:hypothetical protein